MILEDFVLFVLPVHQYFNPTATGFPHPNVGWMDGVSESDIVIIIMKMNECKV